MTDTIQKVTSIICKPIENSKYECFVFNLDPKKGDRSPPLHIVDDVIAHKVKILKTDFAPYTIFFDGLAECKIDKNIECGKNL